MKHTKGKWELGSVYGWEIWVGADVHIADVHGKLESRQANARRICLAVNNFDALLAACKAVNGMVEGEPICQSTLDDVKLAIANAKKVT